MRHHSFSAQDVPEPGTFSIGLMGATSLVFASRRQR
ncbi:PEP-CTERM sorting domain-containing protein [Aquabacterium sp.]